MTNPMFNGSGCKDETSYKAINNVTKEERAAGQRYSKALSLINSILELAGLETVERIKLKDKKTGKVFR